MRFCFTILFSLLSVSAFAQAPARQVGKPRLSVASRNFDVTNYGAVGDAQVATDCSITAGNNHLICTAVHFNTTDVGKAIAVYDAGQQGSQNNNPALVIQIGRAHV